MSYLLLEACKEGNDTMVKVCVSLPRANANVRDEDARTPLHWACKKGHASVVSLLLAVPGIDVNVRGDDDRTPLHYACEGGNSSVVSLLLAHPGIEVNGINKWHDTPLYQACEQNHTEVIELMLCAESLSVDAATAIKGHPLVKDYLADPASTRKRLRDKHNFMTPEERHAADLFALVVFLSDEYLSLPPPPQKE